MIILNQVNINNDGNLFVNISAQPGYIIETAKLWTRDQFRDMTLVRDFTFKLDQSDETEIFALEPEDVNLSNFNGMFFVEFTTDEPSGECDECKDPLLVIVTNFTHYYVCLTELILSSSICVDNLFSKEVCDSNSINKALSINLLMSAIEQSLQLGQITEAMGLVSKIDKLCSKCTSCQQVIRTSSCSTCNSYQV